MAMSPFLIGKPQESPMDVLTRQSKCGNSGDADLSSAHHLKDKGFYNLGIFVTAKIHIFLCVFCQPTTKNSLETPY